MHLTIYKDNEVFFFIVNSAAKNEVFGYSDLLYKKPIAQSCKTGSI